MDNKCEIVLDGIKMSTVAKITEKRIKTITNDELRDICTKLTESDINSVIRAIHSGNAERIKASIEIPLFQAMQKIVKEELKDNE